jgi:transcriptional regulator with XRE-family HTH domain
MTAALKRAPFKKKEGPTDVDIHVGQRLRQRRSLLGLTQESLADATGLTFQQIQKYEQGKNRVSASRLYQLSKILNVDPNYFFDAVAEKLAAIGLAEDQDPFENSQDVFTRKETIDLVKTYYQIEDPKIRKNILKIIKQMADSVMDKE